MTREDYRVEPLTSKNLDNIICCPGGVEVEGKSFCGDISRTLRWREEMFKLGMEGYLIYDGETVGFLEYMPAETAPYPIDAPGSAVIMCFHYKSPESAKDVEHHDMEKHLLRSAVKKIKSNFNGVAALAWDHPVHFPVDMFREIGFSEVRSQDYIYLMWYSFDSDVEEPKMIGPNFEPSDTSEEKRLSVECGYSNRCPYSIHDYNKVKRAILELDDEQVVFKEYRLDTREEAIEFSKEPWTWDWLFLNGDEIDHMRKNKEELKAIIVEKLEEIGK